MTDPDQGHLHNQHLSLEKAAELLMTEVRTVLPGIQTLFGFQLIVVFNNGFHERLGTVGQYLHLLSLGLIAVAIALIMTPAAYQRLAGARHLSEMFLRVCERVLLWSMIPLVLAICIDFYLVARMIVDHPLVPFLAGALFAVFVACWFVAPRILVARERRPTRRSGDRIEPGR